MKTTYSSPSRAGVYLTLVIISVITFSVITFSGVAYAGLKCWSCNGTGWKGQQKCLVCGGDGTIN